MVFFKNSSSEDIDVTEFTTIKRIREHKEELSLDDQMMSEEEEHKDKESSYNESSYSLNEYYNSSFSDAKGGVGFKKAIIMLFMALGMISGIRNVKEALG